jgi:phospholipase/lecithinase/hemolysin
MSRHLGIVLALVFAIGPPEARADVYTFDKIFVFGDSLSDTGNLDNLTSGFYLTPPAFTAGRFTNGKDTTPKSNNYVADGKYNVVWHEQLAKIAQIDPFQPSLLNGNKQNYAFGGATTGANTTIVSKTVLGNILADNMGKQVNDFLVLGKVPATGLYVLWGGGNDLRNVFYQSFSETLNDLTKVTLASVLDAAKQAVKNIAAEITSLITVQGGGSTQFLWPDLPPIDQTPQFLGIDNMKVGDGTKVGDDVAAAVKVFKSDEEAQIALLQKTYAAKNVKIAEMDVYTAFNNIIADTKAGKGSYKDVTNEAQKNANADADTYLFWDGFHPTSHVHYDIAQLAKQSLMDAGLCTPEPSIYVLAMTGAAALALSRLLKKGKGNWRVLLLKGSPHK